MVAKRMAAVAAALTVLICTAAPARASGGFDGLYLKPQIFTRGPLATETASVPGFLDVDAALLIGVMGPTLKLSSGEDIVGTAMTLNAMSSVGLWYGTEVGIDVPVVPARSAAAGYNSSAIGDIGVNIKYLILGREKSDFRLAAGPMLYFPSGSYEQLTGTGNFSFALVAALEKAYGPFAGYANLGFRYQPTGSFKAIDTAPVTENKSQIPLRVALEYQVMPEMLSVTAEGVANIGIDFKGSDTPMEALVEVKYAIAALPVTVIGGGGAGVSSGLGVPQWRVFAGAAYTFKNEPGPAPVAAAEAVPTEMPKWLKDDLSKTPPPPPQVPATPEPPPPATAPVLLAPPSVPAPAAVAPAAPPVPVPTPAAPPAVQAPAPPPVSAPVAAPAPAVDDTLPTMGVPDKDKDGVPDDKDECPTEPGPEWNKGCPVRFDAAGAAGDRKKVLSFHAIVFKKGSDEILGESLKVLDAVVQALKDSPKVKVRVEGHTDNVGNAGNNLVLSQQRALAVMNYLIAKGTDPTRLSYIGFGGSQPVSALKNEEGRKLNRRIEFRVME